MVANKEFHIWFNSSRPVEFYGIHQFVKDHVPSVSPDITTFGIALTKLSSDVTDADINNLIKDNTVDGNYIQWTENSLDSKFGYICETPTLDIGCLGSDDVKGNDLSPIYKLDNPSPQPFKQLPVPLLCKSTLL